MNDKLLKGGELAAKGFAGGEKLLYKNVAKPVVKGTLKGTGYLCQIVDNHLSDDNNEKGDNNQNKNQDNNQNNNQGNNQIDN